MKQESLETELQFKNESEFSKKKSEVETHFKKLETMYKERIERIEMEAKNSEDTLRDKLDSVETELRKTKHDKERATRDAEKKFNGIIDKLNR
jgi:predicted phage gp36 major capsid-like protein